MMLIALALAAAPIEPPSMYLYGVGGHSCAKAMNGNYGASFIWVMGYFSGRNQENSNSVGGTDGEGIMGEVKLICDAEPSTILLNAAHRVYQRLRTRPR